MATSLGIVFGRSVAEIVAKRHSCSKTNILSFLAYEEAIFAEVVAWKGFGVLRNLPCKD